MKEQDIRGIVLKRIQGARTGLSLRDLARSLHLPASAVADAVDGLWQDGMIRPVQSYVSRSVRWVATPKVIERRRIRVAPFFIPGKD